MRALVIKFTPSSCLSVPPFTTINYLESRIHKTMGKKICLETKLLGFLVVVALGVAFVFKNNLKRVVNPPTQCS